jgi:NTE family protein
MKFLRSCSNKRISLALQGGGAHGAFTWGVLDCLLEDGRLRFDGVSGTSAGAMNALVMAYGLLEGGREGARKALARFWTAVGSALPFELAISDADGAHVALTPAFKLMKQWTRHFSPYEFNPLNHNPLAQIVEEQIDFAALRKHSPLKLFISATHANSGRLRLFRNRELSSEALLASACLPVLHHAIEIDGEHYWDGAFAANPAVFPLFYECKAEDILLVMLNPLERRHTPRSADDILNRMHDLAFNAGFLHEMRAFAQAQSFVEASRFKLGRLERRIGRVRFHLIDAHSAMGELASETKLATHLPFLERLRDHGRAEAAAWLDTTFGQVGNRSTADLTALFA